MKHCTPGSQWAGLPVRCGAAVDRHDGTAAAGRRLPPAAGNRKRLRFTPAVTVSGTTLASGFFFEGIVVYSSAARDYILAAVPSGAAQEARYPAGTLGDIQAAVTVDSDWIEPSGGGELVQMLRSSKLARTRTLTEQARSQFVPGGPDSTRSPHPTRNLTRNQVAARR